LGQIAQLGDRCELVGLVVRLELAEHDAILCSPRAHHVHEGLAARITERATQRLAINRNNFSLRHLDQRGDPGAKRILKLRRIERREYATERVVRWDAMLQIEEGSEQLLLGVPKPLNRCERIGSAQNSQ